MVAISQKKIVVCAFEISDQWRYSKDGIIDFPTLPEEKIGEHAIAIFGYDNPASRFTFINSWRPKWGNDGHGYISYEYFDKYVMEAWIATFFDPFKFDNEVNIRLIF